MKTISGNVYLELIGDWVDDSSYIFRDSNRDIEVRLERSPVAKEATPENLMDTIETRLQSLGSLHSLQRGATKVMEQPAATLRAIAGTDPEPDKELIEVLIFKASAELAITLTAQGPSSEQEALRAIWSSVLGSIRIVDPDNLPPKP